MVFSRKAFRAYVQVWVDVCVLLNVVSHVLVNVFTNFPSFFLLLCCRFFYWKISRLFDCVKSVSSFTAKMITMLQIWFRGKHKDNNNNCRFQLPAITFSAEKNKKPDAMPSQCTIQPRVQWKQCNMNRYTIIDIESDIL